MPAPPPNHALAEEHFQALARGLGNDETMRALAEGQRSRWVMTLSSIIDFAGYEKLVDGLELLATVEETNAEAFTAVTTYPLVMAWAHECLENAAEGSDPARLDVLLGQLAGVAAAAAMRGRVDFEISVPIVDGIVTLPSVGRFELETPQTNAVVCCSNGHLELVIDGERLARVEDPSVATPGWTPIRHLEIEHNRLRLRLAVDDIDPHRHLWTSVSRPTPRLDDTAFALWKDSLDAAWKLITRDHCEHAVAIAAGLRVLIPLENDAYQSAQAWNGTFGAAGVSHPRSIEWLAFGILDAFQRSKLHGLQAFLPLHHATYDEHRFYCPWSAEPRSIREMLEGTYLHPLSAMFWGARARDTSDPLVAMDAMVQSTRWRDRAAHVRDRLLASGELTIWGEQILRCIETQLAKLHGENAPSPSVRRLARNVETDYRISWRLANLRPDRPGVGRLANAWMAGVPCPNTISLRSLIVSSQRLNGHLLRQRFAIRHAVGHSTEDDAFPTIGDPSFLAFNQTSSIVGSPESDSVESVSPTLLRAHARWASNKKEALLDYEAVVNADPYDNEGWAGLAITSVQLHHVGSVAFDHCPEFVQTLHRELLEQHGCDASPFELALWLSPLAAIYGNVDSQVED